MDKKEIYFNANLQNNRASFQSMPQGRKFRRVPLTDRIKFYTDKGVLRPTPQPHENYRALFPRIEDVGILMTPYQERKSGDIVTQPCKEDDDTLILSILA
jgi:hypothetical protein